MTEYAVFLKRLGRTYPFERTTMLSASFTVRIRCAIITIVLSFISFDNAVCISVSFLTSREAVASSKRML